MNQNQMNQNETKQNSFKTHQYKPNFSFFYNRHMGPIDEADQSISEFNTKIITHNTQIVLFCNILNYVIHNVTVFGKLLVEKENKKSKIIKNVTNEFIIEKLICGLEKDVRKEERKHQSKNIKRKTKKKTKSSTLNWEESRTQCDLCLTLKKTNVKRSFHICEKCGKTICGDHSFIKYFCCECSPIIDKTNDFSFSNI